MVGDDLDDSSDARIPGDARKAAAATRMPRGLSPTLSFGMAGFLPGTLIATDNGEIPIESLRPGNRVVVLGGDLVTVTRTAHRRIAPRQHPRPASVHPIRIVRDAVAEGIPPRDLLVGPGQILFLSGTPIPARFLLNGTTVLVEPRWASVDYFHVSLTGPGRALAELIPVHACDDVAARRAFGMDGVMELHPGVTTFDLRPSALAQAVQRMLKRRATQKGFAPTPDPDLRPQAPSPA
jgi:hypothetical protein